MCFGLPARVIRTAGLEADIVTCEGRERRVLLAAPEPVRAGDIVVVYGDTVLSKTDKRSALESLRSMKDLALSDLPDGGDVKAVEQLYSTRAARLFGRALRKV